MSASPYPPSLLLEERSDLLLLLLDLAREETHPAGHLVDAADFTDEGALERIDIGVQL